MAYTTINKSSEHFNTKLYTGTGSTQSITGVGFQPDLVWVKDRDVTHWHTLTDIVRGTTKVVYTNSDTAEVTLSNGITSFDSDGFTTGNEVKTNNNGDAFVSWNWLANGSGSSNTDGSITSTVSANTTSGFSIVKYTGAGSNATVGHGLGVTPAMIMIKATSYTQEWVVYHQSVGNTAAMVLHLTDAKNTSSTFWQNTTPSSSAFYIGVNDKHNKSGETFIAYCFAEKQGFSKFGSYTGNGSTDGAFIYTGFKPAFVIAKNTGVSANWVMFDNKRSGFNVDNDEMSPNTNGVDNDGQTYQYVDLLSNGFKWREASNNKNTSGDNFMYMAFAEAPLVGTNNIPATAR